MRRLRLVALASVLATVAGIGRAAAHKPSDAYLTLRADGERLEGRLDVALRDVERAVGVDADRDGAITWGEARAAAPAISAWALARIAVSDGAATCPLALAGVRAARHSDGGYLALALNGRCPAPPSALVVRYDLLFDVDPQHRGLVRVESPRGAHAVVFHEGSKPQAVPLGAPAPRGQALAFFTEGIRHIWIGLDHVLFLLALLLPSVLRREGGRWRAAPELRPVLGDVLRVVTAFTVAHSLTLALAVTDAVRVPARAVEVAIAISVLAAALNNLAPVVGGRWTVAFALGLLHGFGFSNALRELGLPPGGLAASLVGFNLGVEVGQLVIVAAFLPLAYLARRSRAYDRIVVTGGSLAIAAVAAVWAVSRLAP